MNIPEKYDKLANGVIAGLILPLLTALIIFLCAQGDPSLKEWLKKIADADIVVKIITLCVVPDVFIFLFFNHFDMLRASKGVLGMTIVWAVAVFGVKFLL